ncbi:hypothetical protein DPSP01_008121 [Paraphaeosphaeria sporulosa]|uniref:Uncharacterized protein n=1 Tax=Paraphaeosphaeria sporulosa TaxID=1460663 RepID=A0A177C798_9PLEO|nr:uncharacterized protein CC84DRAFT_1250623 [Paraphaeosphaeria sporulosa]OAG02739.1 hypothetical protein CC84DRAFT_1250623 [Paraphaeosphaeria sporulosa]
MFDRYPRCIQQLEFFDMGTARNDLSLETNEDSHDGMRPVPHIMLFFDVTREIARAWYLGRARDAEYSEEKFDKRFAKFEVETLPVVERYRGKCILISIKANGTKDETNEAMQTPLGSTMWQRVGFENSRE